MTAASQAAATEEPVVLMAKRRLAPILPPRFANGEGGEAEITNKAVAHAVQDLALGLDHNFKALMEEVEDLRAEHRTLATSVRALGDQFTEIRSELGKMRADMNDRFDRWLSALEKVAKNT